MRIALDVDRLIKAADTDKYDTVTFASAIRGMTQIIDNEEAAIVTTRNGYLRIKSQDIPILIEELANLHEEIERRKRD